MKKIIEQKQDTNDGLISIIKRKGSMDKKHRVKIRPFIK